MSRQYCLCLIFLLLFLASVIIYVLLPPQSSHYCRFFVDAFKETAPPVYSYCQLDERQNKLIWKNVSGIGVVYPETSVKLHKKCRKTKARRIVATFASGGAHSWRAAVGCPTAINLGYVDACFAISPGLLDKQFQRRNINILKQKRGYGYWIWKPYLLLFLLTEVLSEGDIVFYLDSDRIFTHDFEHYICLQNELDQDVVLFYQEYVEYEWTKADAYYLMNLEGVENIAETMQVTASYMMLRRSFSSISFVSEWLTYAQDSRIVTDSPSRFRNESKDFIENRHDQTILSLLSKRWKIPTWPNPMKDWHHLQEATDRHRRQFPTYNQLDTKRYAPVVTTPIIDWNFSSK